MTKAEQHNDWAFPAGRAFATRFPAEKAGRAQTMAQSLTRSVFSNDFALGIEWKARSAQE
jgi:hypothetical protein